MNELEKLEKEIATLEYELQQKKKLYKKLKRSLCEHKFIKTDCEYIINGVLIKNEKCAKCGLTRNINK